MPRIQRLAAVAAVFLLASPASHAAKPIPKESGFSGFVSLGGGGLHYKSNMIAGTSYFDVGDRRVSSLEDKPSSDSAPIPNFALDVRYTFADAKTQVFFGNSLEDFLRFDFGARLGARRQFGSLGILGASFLLTTTPTEVWEDPYLLNERRGKSDRESQGISLKWESILSSKFDLEFKARNIDVDNEKSGQSIASLTPQQRKLLERDGDQYSVNLDYFWKLSERHRLVPSVEYIDNDLDGDAMANEAWNILLTYLYFGDRVEFVANGSVGKADYDQTNPIFGKKREDDNYGISGQMFYKRPFDLKDWRAYVSAAAYKSDANIDFYLTELATVNVGVLYSF